MTEMPQVANITAVNYLILSTAKTSLWNPVVSVGFHTCDCIMLFDHAWQCVLLKFMLNAGVASPEANQRLRLLSGENTLASERQTPSTNNTYHSVIP
jgi:hypothetical protein